MQDDYIYLLRRHLRQYLIGHGPFFLTCLHAAAKSVVFWRHCRRAEQSRDTHSASKSKARCERGGGGLAHLVAGLAILWIVDPATNHPDSGPRVVLLGLNLRRYHLKRLRFQHIDALLVEVAVPLR